MKFDVVDSYNPEWERYYSQLPLSERDIFYHPSFSAACQESVYRDHRVECAIASAGNDVFLYPHVRRCIQLGRDLTINDITGLYGRGGIATNSSNATHINSFHRELSEYCKQSQILCSFDRYHPVTKNYELVAPGSTVIDVGHFVVLDLQRSFEGIQKSFKRMHRKSLRKAINCGVKIFSEKNIDHLDAFLSVYGNTLRHNNADPFYFFPKAFYEKIEEKMPRSIVFFYAEYDNVIVSTELVLLEGDYCHSYLGGTEPNYRHTCANVLLKTEIIRYCQWSGCKYYLLGGGTQLDDGIYRYKAAFAPGGEQKSYVGGVIFDQEQYDFLRSEPLGVSRPRRFQFYID